ncbi:MAG: alpha-ketoacid dehydrogenase subunit beta [Candidatus Woesearchaeota archaeon]
MVSALNEALRQEMERDKSVMILGEDVGKDGGVFRVTDGLIDTFGENRVIDTPLAEAGIVGTSIGLAVNGMKPVCEIQFSGFTYQAFHQIKQHMARFRQRSEGDFPLPMVVRAPSSGGIRALEHHSESPEAFYAHCQGLKVVIPSGPKDAKGLLISAIRDPDPVIFLEPKKIYRSFKEEVPDESYTIPLGKAATVREGEHVSLITWGAMVHVCKEAAEKLEKQGIKAEIIDLRTIHPMDTEAVMASVKKTHRAVIVHEAPGTAGFGGEVASRIQEQCLLFMEAPVLRVTGYDVPFPQFALENYYLPDAERVIEAVKKTMGY